MAELGLKDPPLIVAAGGISTGNDIWQCMKLGADAVCIGTLFAVAQVSYKATKPSVRPLVPYSILSVAQVSYKGHCTSPNIIQHPFCGAGELYGSTTL